MPDSPNNNIDSLKVEIFRKVMNMQNVVKLQNVRECVEKICKSRKQLALGARVNMESSGKIDTPREGPVNPGNGPTRWTPKELKGQLEGKFTYEKITSLDKSFYNLRDKPPNYRGPPPPAMTR